MESLHQISNVQVYGAILFLIGLVFRYWVNRRRFNRSTYGGTQVFNNYEQKVALTFIEKQIKRIGFLLIAFGLFLIVIEIFNHRRTNKAIAEIKSVVTVKHNS